MNESDAQPLDDAQRWARLTDKQRACLDLLLERKTSKQIARELNIAKPTVDQRIASARRNLGASNRDEVAIIYARLKAMYDRVIYDPVQLPQTPSLMPTIVSDVGEPDGLTLKESTSDLGAPSGEFPPFKDLWRHSSIARILTVAILVVTMAMFLLASLGIAQALSQLLSD